MQLSLHIANRFRRSQKASGYLSFMSLSSISGIALGCFVLITLLSVMNGFERELTQKLLSVIPHGEIYAVDNSGLKDWQRLQQNIELDSNVAFVSPFTQITGLVQKKSVLKPIAISGLALGKDETAMLSSAVDASAFELLKQSESGIIIGRGIAKDLSVDVGDQVDVLIPKSGSVDRLSAPKRVSMTIVGLLSMGGEIDSKLGIMNLRKASDLLNVSTGAQGIRIALNDPFAAPQIVRQYGFYLDQPVYLSNWTRTHGHIFQDIQLVRIVVYIVLTLVIAVACFNVVSTLVMGVRSKQSSIAILMSMGATPALIQRIFLWQGISNGFIGTAIGTVLALLVVPQLSSMIAAIESAFGVKVLSSDVYFIDFLPTALHWDDVVMTVSIGVLLSTIAAYYPARRAAQVQPAQALS